jgi:hypothetical protein
VCRADNLTTFMCRLSRNSGSLNLLEPQGSVQACNGVAFINMCVLQANCETQTMYGIVDSFRKHVKLAGFDKFCPLRRSAT